MHPSLPLDKDSVYSGEHVISWAKDAWISQHEENLQPAIREVVDSVRYVRRDEFILRLGESTTDIIKQLRALYSNDDPFEPKKHAIVLVEPRKSNKWVAEIASKYNKFTGADYYSLGSKGAKTFVDYTKDAQIHSFSGRTIVLFDDASFSGTQLHDHVFAIQQIAKQLQIRAVAVVAPFMTERANERIAALSSKQVPVLISAHQRITSIANLTQDNSETIRKLWGYSPEEVRGIGLTWFSHKVPNYQSFPLGLAHGSIYSSNGTVKPKSIRVIPEVDPIYKEFNTAPITIIKPNELKMRSQLNKNNVLNIQQIRSIETMFTWLKDQKEEVETTVVVCDIDDTLVRKGSDALVEEQTAAVVQHIQNAGFRVIGCTARGTDQVEKTLAQLGGLGITLGTQRMRESDVRTVFEGSGIVFYKGIFFADPSSKGKGAAISYFCRIRKITDTVVMLDDRLEELEKVKNFCRKEGVRFYGFKLQTNKKTLK